MSVRLMPISFYSVTKAQLLEGLFTCLPKEQVCLHRASALASALSRADGYARWQQEVALLESHRGSYLTLPEQACYYRNTTYDGTHPDLTNWFC